MLGAEHRRVHRRPGRLDRHAVLLRGERQLLGRDGRHRLAPGALRAGHQQHVVLVVQAVRLVEEVEGRARGALVDGPAVAGDTGRRHAGDGEAGLALRRDDARARGHRAGHAADRGRLVRDHTAVRRDALQGCNARDALRSAERVGPGVRVLRQSLARDVAAIGIVKAPSRPLPRPWRRDHRSQRPSARAGPGRPAPQPHAAAAPWRCGPSPSGALRHPGPAYHPRGTARRLKQRQPGATGTTAPDPTAFSRSGTRPVELPTLRAESGCTASKR